MYGLELRNLKELRNMAGELKISGRSKMKRDELLAAIEGELYGGHAAKADIASLNKMIRDERHKVVPKAA